jgi:serine protease AprX
MTAIPEAEVIYLERWVVEQLMFGSGRVRRFTQDTPVLPDVWIQYATNPSEREMTRRHPGVRPPLDLLLTPFRDVATGLVRTEVRKRVESERGDEESRLFHADPLPPKVLYHQSAVMATLYFEDLVRAVIPMTDWWRRLAKRFDVKALQNKKVQFHLAEAVIDPEHPLTALDGKTRYPADMLWLIRVVGAIALVHQDKPLDPVFTTKNLGPGKATPEQWLPLVEAVAAMMETVDPPEKPDVRIHSVALNRLARPTVSGSRLAVKADAAKLLFNISCKDIRWAVLDSGIDATHPAFRRKLSDDEKVKGRGHFSEHGSRIRATYDFSQIHDLLDADDDKLTKHLDVVSKGNEDLRQELEDKITDLNASLNAGRSIDWGVLAPLLQIRHDASYEQHVPTNDHGTHVAGIIGANWTHDEDGKEREDKLIGVCEDIELYDLRILDPEGDGDEFTVMAALQFVRWLNATNDYMAVHGVNMSLSIPHDVANYACGRTPVCDEAERVVSSGIVVVVAAGNQGYRTYTSEGSTVQAYNTISITDPGNADMVITVGATHRARPHTYGVSYFSSRGPTGDGRLKPDLVAPGEKITAPLPGGLYGLKDGTSMAAPHVSGAAAMLMARHNELVGRPQRIKQILCETATDLGRERYFQGAGMLDILRAMQSV